MFDIADKVRLTKINEKLFRIGKWSRASQLFFDIFAFGAILFVLTLFNIIPWVLMWFYVIFIIFLSGFIFTRPGQKYNMFLVIGILSILAFIPSQSCQALLLSTGSQPVNPYADDDLKYTEWNKGWNAYLSGLERESNPYNSVPDTPLVIELRNAWHEGYDTCNDYGAQEMPDTLNPFRETSEQYTAWENGYNSSDINDNPYNQLTQTSLYHAYRDGFYTSHGYTDADTIDASHLWGDIQKLGVNPFNDLQGYMLNFMNVVNWIVFLCIVGYGIASVKDVITFNWGNVAKKGAIIALAITIMTLTYSIFSWAEIPIQTIWDTVGDAWNTMLRNVGIGMLDATTGENIVNVYTVTNSVFRWIPLFFVVGMLSFAIAFRNRDLKSILFAKYATEEDSVEVREMKFSIATLVLIAIIGIYIIGYFLTTAEPTLTVDPTITLVFYITAVFFLFFIGMRWFIINKDLGYYSQIKGIIFWTIYGLMALFLWFQVAQPAFFNMGWTDTSSGLLTFSQDQSIIENDVFKQLFLVAAPETIIFQAGLIGLSNRIYYAARRGAIQKNVRKDLEQKKEKLIVQKEGIPIDPDSNSKKNLRNVGKWVALQKKIDALDYQLEKATIARVPYSYFVISTIIGSLIGSFIFSDYHRFRRDIDFWQWWQNPNLGLVYYGAGFLLSVIAFFNWFAAVLVHALNNIISLWLTGGLA